MRAHRNKLLAAGGFLTEPDDLKKLIQEDRLQSVLIRCGGGRFTCPAQDAQHFIDIINRDGKEYVRDASVNG